MRRFFLADENGREWALNGENLIWLGNPAGLGASLSNEYADIKQGFFSVLDTDKWSVQSVIADLCFMRPAYETYREFVDWLVPSVGLTLIYQPFGEERFFRSVKLDYINKTELSNGAWLVTPISLSCLSPWYKPKNLTVQLAGDVSGAMQYPYIYDGDLVYGSSIAGAYSTELQPSGHLPAAVTVKYVGAVSNPIITLTGKNSGREIGRAQINAEFTASDVLEFSTKYSDSHIRKNGVNIIQSVSPGSDPFFHIPLGEPAILRIQSTGTLTGSAEASIFYYYRSV